MNEQENRQDDIQDNDQNVIADLDTPNAEEIKGGARNVTNHNTYTGTLTLGTDATIGATQGRSLFTISTNQ